MDKIQAALGLLPPRQRIIFDLRYDRHLDIKDIAAELRCSESNIKTQLFRALAGLLAFLVAATTVSTIALRAARAHPAHSLRTE